MTDIHKALTLITLELKDQRRTLDAVVGAVQQLDQTVRDGKTGQFCGNGERFGPLEAAIERLNSSHANHEERLSALEASVGQLRRAGGAD